MYPTMRIDSPLYRSQNAGLAAMGELNCLGPPSMTGTNPEYSRTQCNSRSTRWCGWILAQQIGVDKSIYTAFSQCSKLQLAHSLLRGVVVSSWKPFLSSKLSSPKYIRARQNICAPMRTWHFSSRYGRWGYQMIRGRWDFGQLLLSVDHLIRGLHIMISPHLDTSKIGTDDCDCPSTLYLCCPSVPVRIRSWQHREMERVEALLLFAFVSSTTHSDIYHEAYMSFSTWNLSSLLVEFRVLTGWCEVVAVATFSPRKQTHFGKVRVRIVK